MATRMVVEDGKYTGEVAFYCYGEGKVEAIRELAAREGYALEHCYAYSDSVTDLPMLEAVGHPDGGQPRPRDCARRPRPAAGRCCTFSRPVSLRDRLPPRRPAPPSPPPSAVGASALAAGALTYSLLRRFAFMSRALPARS